MTDADLSSKLQGELVDEIVREVFGEEFPRGSPGCPTLSKKEALCILAFVRATKRAMKTIGGEHGNKQGTGSI